MQLWNIPELRESLTLRSAEVIIFFWLAQGLNHLTCDPSYQMRLEIEGLADCATATQGFTQGTLRCEK